MSIRKIAGIVWFVTIVSIALTWRGFKSYLSSGHPVWFPVVLIPVAFIVVISLAIGYLIIRHEVLEPFKHFVVTRYGIKTVGVVVRSSRCYDPEDTCLCGSYKFSGLRGKDHEFEFKICIHWPSDEQWKLVKQGYSEGAQNPVYYLRYLPLIHEIQFPI